MDNLVAVPHDGGMHPTPIAITVGTGKVGSRVAQRLGDAGIAHRIGSRRGQPPFDWDRPGTWAPFVEGCRSAFVAYVPDLGFPGGSEALSTFGEVCAAAGLEHLVLLSGRGEEGAAASEAALAATAPSLTVVRAAWFDQNFSEAFLRDQVLEGAVALPAGSVVEPFVDAGDIADVVVTCLGDPSAHQGRTHEVTGPELLSFADVAAVLTRATGRTVAYVPLEVDEYVAGAVDAGMAPEEAKVYAELFASITDGRNAHLTGDVEALLGRPPVSFEAFASTAAAAGAWDR